MDEKSGAIGISEGLAFSGQGTSVLLGDLYRPAGRGPHPVMVAVHGGGWGQGSRSCYRDWGRCLAANGFALFAVDRRHFKPDEAIYPRVIEDVQAAVRHLRSHAASFDLDPRRMGLMGDSSGGYLAALAGLVAAGAPPLPDRDTPCGEDAGREAQPASAAVRVVVAFYGVFDLAAEWNFEQVARPFDRVTERLLGVPLVDDRRRYFDASPIAYATRDRNHVAFFLAWGTADEVVSEELHSRPFARTLAQAGFNVHTAIVPSAQHYWATEPHDDEMSPARLVAPRLVRFLRDYL